jgi:hypothetical protein
MTGRLSLGNMSMGILLIAKIEQSAIDTRATMTLIG